MTQRKQVREQSLRKTYLMDQIRYLISIPKSSTCPGMFKCQGRTNGLPLLLSNSEKQFPEEDDEWFCNTPCPVGCTCMGHEYQCSAANFTYVPPDMSAEVRGLNISGNNIDLYNETFRKHLYLAELDLSFKKIRNLYQVSF